MRQVLLTPVRSPYPLAKARIQKGVNGQEPDLSLASFQLASLKFKSTLKELKTALDPEIVKGLNQTFKVKGKTIRQRDLLELIQGLSQENKWSPKQNLKRLGFASLYTSWVATLGVGYVATHLVMDMLSISGETLQFESAKTFFQGARLEHLKELLTDSNTPNHSQDYIQQLYQLEQAGLIKTVKKHRVWRSSETLGYTLTDKGKLYLSQLQTKAHAPEQLTQTTPTNTNTEGKKREQIVFHLLHPLKPGFTGIDLFKKLNFLEQQNTFLSRLFSPGISEEDLHKDSGLPQEGLSLHQALLALKDVGLIQQKFESGHYMIRSAPESIEKTRWGLTQEGKHLLSKLQNASQSTSSLSTSLNQEVIQKLNLTPLELSAFIQREREQLHQQIEKQQTVLMSLQKIVQHHEDDLTSQTQSKQALETSILAQSSTPDALSLDKLSPEIKNQLDKLEQLEAQRQISQEQTQHLKTKLQHYEHHHGLWLTQIQQQLKNLQKAQAHLRSAKALASFDDAFLQLKSQIQANPSLLSGDEDLIQKALEMIQPNATPLASELQALDIENKVNSLLNEDRHPSALEILKNRMKQEKTSPENAENHPLEAKEKSQNDARP